MSAEEWLKAEELNNPLIKGSDPRDELFPGYKCSTLMERFANYKTRNLEVQIFGWREKLKKDADLFEELPYKTGKEYLEKFDEYFGIQKV